VLGCLRRAWAPPGRLRSRAAIAPALRVCRRNPGAGGIVPKSPSNLFIQPPQQTRISITQKAGIFGEVCAEFKEDL